MKLFDFLKLLFTNSDFNFNNYERAKYFFMVNRFMAIRFPHIANGFNHIDINTGQVVNSYHDAFKNSKGIPPWIFNGIKGVKETRDEIYFDEKLEDMYCKLNNITYKEVKRIKELYPKEFEIELKEIAESMENSYHKY